MLGAVLWVVVIAAGLLLLVRIGRWIWSWAAPLVYLIWHIPELARGQAQYAAWVESGGPDARLLDAVWRGDATAARRALAEGADPNVRGPLRPEHIRGETVLSSAARHTRADLVMLLLHHGADANAADADGKTPLFYAIQREHEESCRALLAAGADLNRADKNGVTPLMEAAEATQVWCVPLLLKAGAHANARDCEGWTPLLWATSAQNVRALIAAGADVNAADAEGFTPLMAAAQRGDLGSVEALLENGAKVNARDGEGETPLPTPFAMGTLVSSNCSWREVPTRRSEVGVAKRQPTLL